MGRKKLEKKLNKKVISRRGFLQAAGTLSAGLVVQACVSGQPIAAPTGAPAEAAAPAATPTISAAKSGLAEGMIGGPTGFEGAERYQYGPDSPAGRAIEALKSLPADQKPEQLTIQLADGALGHFQVPFPEGAQTAQEIFEEETGIKLDFVGISPDDQLTKIIQDTTTKAGQFDLYSFWGPNKGTLAESGALLNLDEFVAKHQPMWEEYYTGGDITVQQFNAHAGSFYAVSFDGDYQIWSYRQDLFEDSEEQKKFMDQYGWELQWPETWEQLDQIAEFFHRPDQNLFGATDLRNQFWGYTNWYQRYASFANPNQFYFDPDSAQPLIASEAGIKAAQEYADTLAFHSPDGISWGWPEQYANMAAAGACLTCAFPNMPKFLDTPDNPDSQIVGKIRSGLSPGRIVDGKLIRRTVWWPNVTLGVSAQSESPEAAYLFLQWANSPQLYPWLVANPAGFMDPFQKGDFEDPFVVASYHDYHIPTYQASIEHAVPPINLNGTNEYINSLDTNLQAVMIGQKSAEQAMQDAAAEWEEITDRLGRDKQVAALQAQASAYPTIVDEPTM
jgi:multiple sugar transport system substrate-binding protein